MEITIKKTDKHTGEGITYDIEVSEKFKDDFLDVLKSYVLRNSEEELIVKYI